MFRNSFTLFIRANWKLGVFKKTIASRSVRILHVLYKIHPHLTLPFRPGPRTWRVTSASWRGCVQKRVAKHIAIPNSSNMDYGERCAYLGWQQLTERRVRGDLIFTYQHLHGNAHLQLDWLWVAPLSSIDGLAASVRANDRRPSSTVHRSARSSSPRE